MSRTLDFGPGLQVLIGDKGLARLRASPAREPGVRVMLVRSAGKGLCAAGNARECFAALQAKRVPNVGAT